MSNERTFTMRTEAQAMAPHRRPDVWHATFWGWVRVPAGTSDANAQACAHIAFKGGIHEDAYVAGFRRWFRRLAERRPDLAAVHVFDVYPVDELRWLGPYEASSYWRPPTGEPIAQEAS